MHKYISRVTYSRRGEAFNPLVWPFLLATFAYGIGFTFFLPFNNILGSSSVYDAMKSIGAVFPILWGILALLTIILGLSFLMFNIPPFGKVSGLVGFALWVFVAMCYILGHDWMVLVGVAMPNMWFWFWQYLSLSVFRREDAEDAQTMKDYRLGLYDNEDSPEESRLDRERNRGVDRQ